MWARTGLHSLTSESLRIPTDHRAGGGSSGGPPSPSYAQQFDGGSEELDAEPENPSLPPVPWDPANLIVEPQFESFSFGEMSSMESLESEPPIGLAGFYQVVRTGVHLVGLTNGMTISGSISVPIEAGWTEGLLWTLALPIDNSGSLAVGSLRSPFLDPYPYLVIDTTRLTNGTHNLAGEAVWLIDPNNPYSFIQLASAPITVQVFNEISFPDWMEGFGELYDSMYINAQSAHPHVTWQAAIFGANEDYIGSFSGHTDTGEIEAIWNLLDPSGNPRSDTTFWIDIYTTVDGTGGGSPPADPLTFAAAAPVKKKKFDPWSGPGNWVVANQQAFNFLTGHENLDTMTDGWVGPAESRNLSVQPPTPIRQSGEALRIRTNQNSTNDWTNLRLAIVNSTTRNIYYFGHGGKDQIGDGTNVFTHIDSFELTNVLGTATLSSTNKKAFRYVFLDGCETGATSKMAEGFGIPAKEKMKLEDFIDNGIRPCAFMGWKQTKWIGFMNTVWFDHIFYVQGFQYEWINNGKTIKQASDAAKSYPGTTQINVSNLRIFGFPDLMYNQYNGQ